MEYLPAGIELHDRDGQPVDVYIFLRLYSNPDYRQIARDEHDDLVISTVWLGTNQPGRDFETIIYRGTLADIRMRQYYATYDEAASGHTTFALALKAGI